MFSSSTYLSPYLIFIFTICPTMESTATTTARINPINLYLQQLHLQSP
ncbi:hypothetical protein M8C21_012612 [Ambrosia artemisiifolia]|uniref:Uncharacterized protein n=1 Tax=Ambrosia artemisiifolia TaxID=4212 RepID=A0AAD5BR30_AMBAR|nr:hypothetical protein M8C21_012612 [Ambrosia artemisiifolia]